MTTLDDLEQVKYAEPSPEGASWLRQENAELRATVELWESGRGLCQLATDPPSLASPRVEATAGDIPGWWLQQTCNGIPIWICACCITLTVGSPKPAVCVGCGEPDLGEALYPNVRIDQDEPDKLLSE